MTELSPEARALIATVGRADGLDPKRRAELEWRLAASAAALGTTLSVAKGSAASAKPALAAGAATSVMPLAPTAGAIGLWMSVGAVVGGVSVASISQLTAPPVVEAPAYASAQIRAQPLRAERATGSTVPREGALLEPAVAREPGAPRPSAAPRKPSAPAVTELEASPEAAALSTAIPSNVSLEARSLEAARRELAAGRAAQALSELARHEQQFPAGVLREERLALTTVALCSLGRREEARRIAEAFLLAAPRSPLVPRLRESCAFSGGDNWKQEAP